MSDDTAAHRTMETQLALIRRDLDEIHAALYGNGKDKKGIIDQVELLAEAADRGRWALKVVLWIGGSVVALLTALAQLRTALSTIWGHA